MFKINYFIILIFFILFIFVANENQLFDSYVYSLNIRDGFDLFHPHHPLYNFFGYILYNILLFTGLESLKLLSLANSVFGIVVLALIFIIIQEQRGKDWAAIAVCSTGFLFSFWFFSTSVEVNMPAIMFLLIGIYLLFFKQQSRVASFAVYFLLAMGILFHQIVVLAVIPIIVYQSIRERSLTRTLLYASPGMISGLIAYVVIGITQIHPKGVVEYYYWLTKYSHNTPWGIFTVNTIPNSLWGIFKTFFGGFVTRQVFFSGELTGFKIAYFTFVIFVCAGFIWFLVTAILKFSTQLKSSQCLLLSLAVIFSGFSLWWAPADEGFWLYPVIFIMLFIFREDWHGYYRKKAAMAVLIFLMITNLFFTFLPLSQKSNSVAQQGADVLSKLDMNADDLALTVFESIAVALRYHHKTTMSTDVFVLFDSDKDDSLIAAYHRKIEQNPGRVIVFGDEEYPEPCRGNMLQRFSKSDYARIYGPYKTNLVPIDSIYVYRQKVRIYLLEHIENENSHKL